MREKDRPVYMIGVAARLTKMHPQTLRMYERKKLVRPGRTEKSTRLYSQRNIEQLRYIQGLTQKRGVNLAGVRLIMDLRSQLEEAEEMLSEARQRVDRIEAKMKREVSGLRNRYCFELVHLPKAAVARVKNDEE